MKLKKFENFQDDDSGEILLYFGDDEPTTWYFIEDAITDGLLDDKFQLDDDVVEQIGNECFYTDFMTQGELADVIIEDFEGSIQRIFHYLIIDVDYLEKESRIEIKGVSEDGDRYYFSYKP